MIEQIKENPVKASISALTLISMLVGGVLAVDSRYAKAGDIVKQERMIEQSTHDMKAAITQIRRQDLEDKIFDLELIPENKRTQIDKAKLNKYKRDIDAIDKLNSPK